MPAPERAGATLPARCHHFSSGSLSPFAFGEARSCQPPFYGIGVACRVERLAAGGRARPLRLVALAAGIGLLGHLGRLSLAFGNHHESVEVRDEDVYLPVPVISKDEEVARVSADPLVLGPASP